MHDLKYADLEQLQFFASGNKSYWKKLKLKKMHIFLWTICIKYWYYVQIIELSQFFKTDSCHTFTQKSRKDLNENYRSVSILPTLSKKFERVMFAQVDISDFFDGDFSKEQCGFRKGYSTQHCNLKMLKKWTKCFGKGKVSGALLIDLVKPFDCLDHKLLTAR